MERKEKRTGIKHYERMRRYLGGIYLYGFLKRKDFASKNDGSAKNYSFMIHLIQALLSIGQDGEQKRDSHSIRRKYHLSGNSRLTDSYMYHALDPQSNMVEFLHILATLNSADKSMPQLSMWVESHAYSSPSKGTIRDRVKTLTDYGCIENKADKSYTLAEDGLRLLTDAQLLQLYHYVCFVSGITYPRVAGSFLRRTLERYLYAKNLAVPQQSPMLLRHSSNHVIFDEELLYLLQTYMKERMWVSFDGRKRLPVQVRVDAQLGRWYVLCVDENIRPCIEKLANVETLEGQEVASDLQWTRAAKTIEKAYAHVLFSSKTRKPVLVEAKLGFANAPGLYRQFLREIRVGKVVQRPDGKYYEVWTADPLELKPFLRTYAPYLRILPGDHDLTQLLRSDLSRMLDALDKEESV